MALSLLSIDALEIVVNYVNMEDKCNLFMTGQKLLTSKLTQVATDISVLPYIRDEEDGLCTSRTNFDESICMLDVNSKQVVRNIIMFRYKKANHVVIHDEYFERAVTELRHLEGLMMYVGSIPSCNFALLPSTLSTLRLNFDPGRDVKPLFEHLHSTLTFLLVIYSGGHYIDVEPQYLRMLPPNLETLCGFNVNSDAQVEALPQSLTMLGCDDLDKVSSMKLPPRLTSIDASDINISSLAHLQLTKLQCIIGIGDNLASLRSLTEVSAMSFLSHVGAGWKTPVQFPPSVTKLTIQGTSPVCYIIPASVKQLSLRNHYNVFTPSTGTWNYNGSNVVHNIPDDVVHANVYVDYPSRSRLETMVGELAATVVSLKLSVCYCDHGMYRFDVLKHCKKLILPDGIMVTAFPPSIIEFKGQYVDDDAVKIPTTLKHLITTDGVLPCDVRKMQLDHLECDGCMILGDIECVSYIATVILHLQVSDSSYAPVLPNVRYVYKNEQQEDSDDE